MHVLPLHTLPGFSHLFPAQQVPSSEPQVMQLPELQTISTLFGPGAWHWPPSAMQVPPISPAE
jgi:hypothetical protein